jgi:cytochrome b561
MLRSDFDAEQRVFDRTTRLLHWLTVGLITLVFVLAFSIDLTTSRGSRTALPQLHRSFGVTLRTVILVRLVWRQFGRFPNWTTAAHAPRGDGERIRAIRAQPILSSLACANLARTAFSG